MENRYCNKQYQCLKNTISFMVENEDQIKSKWLKIVIKF